MGAKTFEDVVVWQKAHSFVLAVYGVSRLFPREETFGLTSQLRRAAVSIAANIAEGFKRSGKGDKLRFYNMSQASLEECRYYLILASDLQYADTTELTEMADEVARMLDAYMTSLRRAGRLSPTVY
jgi:four helix bundle protein